MKMVCLLFAILQTCIEIVWECRIVPLGDIALWKIGACFTTDSRLVSYRFYDIELK